MYIECLENNPRVEMNAGEYVKLRNIFNVSKNNISVFLEINKVGRKYKICNIYVPKQKADDIHDIIDAEELNNLGRKYMGVCIGNLKSADFSKENYTFLESCFCGVDNFIGITMTKSGFMKAVIYDGSYVFCDCDVVITVNTVANNVDRIKKKFLGNITAWTYGDGYSQTDRDNYEVPPIIALKKGWEDVV